MITELFRVVYGSKLYGTSTPASDTDVKAVYLPTLDSLLLGRKQSIYKTRVDEHGVKVPDAAPMPERGIETEFFPLQTFVRDFVQGQTYALEMAFAVLQGGDTSSTSFKLVNELVEQFANSEVYSMVGFAVKQTFDYVRRGERLNDAKEVLEVLRDAESAFTADKKPRLDSLLANGDSVIDFVARQAKLKTSTSVNNNRILRVLELNGRSYLETTTIEHLVTLLQKLISSYGERTIGASERDVDYKSLSHAIRVYQQSIELLDTLTITFPRPNAAYLLSVKQGREDLESVKVLLRNLDDEVQLKIERSTVRRKTPELVEAAEQWLLQQLQDLYKL